MIQRPRPCDIVREVFEARKTDRLSPPMTDRELEIMLTAITATIRLLLPENRAAPLPTYPLVYHWLADVMRHQKEKGEYAWYLIP